MSTIWRDHASNAVTAWPRDEPVASGDVQRSHVISAVDWHPRLWGVLERIGRLADLPDDWDSYGGHRIAELAIRGIYRLLRIIESEGMPTPQVVPVSDGGLQLEWYLPGRELELEVLPDGSVEYLAEDDAGKVVEGQLPSYRARSVHDILGWLTEG